MRVLVTGAAGSGTSSLAAALAQHWAVAAVEADAFYWLPTEPHYTSRRDPEAREAMFKQELLSHERLVVAGSVVGWGIEDLLDLVVFLYVDASVRIRRLRAREEARFGQANPAFLEWAAQYDEGPPEGRSLAKHEVWLRTLACPVIRLEGEFSVAEQVERLVQAAPNPSVERTHNGGARLLAPSPTAAPLRAAHVNR